MANKIYRVDIDGNVNVAVKLRTIPKEVSKNVQQELMTYGKVEVDKNIKSLMPVSKKSKQHAKYSNAFEVTVAAGQGGFRNLGFYMRPTSEFWYVKFPNNGTGTSKKNAPQNFVQRGVYKSYDKINSLINKAVQAGL